MLRRSTCRIYSPYCKLLISYFITMVVFTVSTFSQSDEKEVNLHWYDFPAIPPPAGESVQPGLAGPVSGVDGNFMFVAGGANFEGGMPWNGGQKRYHDVIYLLEKKSETVYLWKQAAEKLPYPMAYSACVSMPQGVVSIGGEDEHHPVKEVFLFSFADGRINRMNLPDLPKAISSASAATIGSAIFVAGGLDASGASNTFYSLDMKNPEIGWTILPQLPVAVSHAVVVSQQDGSEKCIYVIGGRNKTTEVSTFLSSIWKYSPSSGKWHSEGAITSNGKIVSLSAGTGIAFGSHHIVLFGGDPGIFFNRTERLNTAIEKAPGEDEKQKLRTEKEVMLTNHPGFSKEVLSFNTLTKVWEHIGETGHESPVTTSAFVWNGTVVIPSGEVRPGIRTPNTLGIKVKYKK
jgi:N-acetylneuraminate epimerase